MTGISSRRFTSSLRCAALAALAFAAAPAIAQENKVQVQTGLMCDTVEQAVKVSHLVNKGDIKQALLAVNLEAAKPTACGVAEVAFTPEEMVAEVRNDFGAVSFRILRIVVIGIKGPEGFRRIAPVAQFALVKEKTIEV